MKSLDETLRNPPMKQLNEPKEHWDFDGKSCTVQTHEIDYIEWKASILALVGEKKTCSCKTIWCQHSEANKIHNQAIDEILKRMGQ